MQIKWIVQMLDGERIVSDTLTATEEDVTMLKNQLRNILQANALVVTMLVDGDEMFIRGNQIVYVLCREVG